MAFDIKDADTSEAHSRDNATDDIQQTEIKPFRILDLPAELRTMIYRMALTSLRPINMIEHMDETDEDDFVIFCIGHRSTAAPALLHACRQIRNEARSIYYSSNTFYFDVSCVTLKVVNRHWWPEEVVDWLTALESDDAAAVRHITWPSGYNLFWRLGLDKLKDLCHQLKRTQVQWGDTVVKFDVHAEGRESRYGCCSSGKCHSLPWSTMHYATLSQVELMLSK